MAASKTTVAAMMMSFLLPPAGAEAAAAAWDMFVAPGFEVRCRPWCNRHATVRTRSGCREGGLLPALRR
jgi:hypothetical protein